MAMVTSEPTAMGNLLVALGKTRAQDSHLVFQTLTV